MEGPLLGDESTGQGSVAGGHKVGQAVVFQLCGGRAQWTTDTCSQPESAPLETAFSGVAEDLRWLHPAYVPLLGGLGQPGFLALFFKWWLSF